MPVASLTINWDDGSGDKLYLTPYTGSSGQTPVVITSDANATGIYRTKQVKFYVINKPEVYVWLTIKQSAGGDLWVLGLGDNIVGYNSKAIGRVQ